MRRESLALAPQQHHVLKLISLSASTQISHLPALLFSIFWTIFFCVEDYRDMLVLNDFHWLVIEGMVMLFSFS